MDEEETMKFLLSICPDLKGVRYVSAAVGNNCYDYACGSIGIFFLSQVKLGDEIDPTEGCLVVYYDEDGKEHHAGRYIGKGRVVSQWDTLAVLEHDVMEVLGEYGTIVKYFKRPSEN